jgi:hypothetical protein
MRRSGPRRAGVPPDVAETVLTRDRGCVAHRYGFAVDIRCQGRLHVHHVILRSHGGPHTEANLLTLCDRHHDHAHNHDRAGAEACHIIVRR